MPDYNIKVLIALLTKAHDELNVINSSGMVKYVLCYFCGSKIQNGLGIIHTKDCILVQIRKAIPDHV